MTDADMEAAYEFVGDMAPRADITHPFPAWHGWALRDAYLAGLKAGRAMTDAELLALLRDVWPEIEGFRSDPDTPMRATERLTELMGRIDGAIIALDRRVKTPATRKEIRR